MNEPKQTTPLPDATGSTTASSGARSRFRELWPERLVETANQLVSRIQERFPGSGLQNVAVELRQISLEALERSEWIRRPNYWLRGGVGTLVVSMLGVLAVVGYTEVKPEGGYFQIEDFIQTLEAAIGSVVFLGAAIVYLVSLERRWKRERALDAFRELRSLAHIVDMHQLTKDPESTLRGKPTASSPKRSLTQFELGRYLDYCSELLSLINKIGAIYVQEFPDPVALDAVDQLSNLTNGLSRNIWQKLMILDLAIEPKKTSSILLSTGERSATNLESPAEK